MQQFKMTRLPFRVRIIATIVGLGSGWGGFDRTRRPPPGPTPRGYGHAIFVLVRFPGMAEEWVIGKVGNEKPSFDAVKSGIPVPKNY